ncbi:hypothetical protein D3C85_1056740 [compost metagenome]
MLKAWLAHASFVAAQIVAFASNPASVISINLSYAPGLPGKRRGIPNFFEIEAYTAITITRFMGLPKAVPATTEGLSADQVHFLPF